MSKAKTTRIKKALNRVESREGMEECVRAICMLTINQDELTARMDEELARVRDRYMDAMSALQVNLDDEMERAKDWAERNPDEFASRKSIVMVHGTVGYRIGNPTLKPVSGMNWDKVLEFLQDHFPEYVRVAKEVDRETLLARREEIGNENLRLMGLRVFQTERFYVEPNREAVQA